MTLIWFWSHSSNHKGPPKTKMREREEEGYVRVQRPKMHVKVGGKKKKKGARGRRQVLGVKKMETKRESGAAYTAH